MPSRGPTSGRKHYATPAFPGAPKKEDKSKSGYITLAFSGVQKNPYVLRIFFPGAQKWGE